MKLQIWTLVLTSLLGCGKRWQPIDYAALPSHARAQGLAGIVLEKRTDVRFHLDGDLGQAVADTTSYQRVRVFNDKARQYLQHTESYNRNIWEIKAFDARLSEPVDKETYRAKTWKMSDAMDLPAFPSGVLFTSARILALPVPALPEGSVWEAQSVVRQLQPRLFPARHLFGGELVELKSQLTVRFPLDWQVEFDVHQGDKKLNWPPVETLENAERVLTWYRDDLPEHQLDQRAPPLWAQVPILQVRLLKWTENGHEIHGFPSPQALSKWLYDASTTTRQLTPAMEQKTAELLQGTQTPRQKTAKLLGWVRREVSYCAVEVDMGGWIPHAATQVFEVRNGDCKDKANLLQALLAHAGIASRGAELYSHSGVPKPFLMPTLGGSNHQILVVDLADGPVVVDPTARFTPLGELPDGDRSTVLLPFSATGSDLMPVAAATAAQNSWSMTADVQLLPKPEMDFRLQASGSVAASLRSAFVEAAVGARDKAMAEWLPQSNLTVQKTQVVPVDPDEAEPALLSGHGVFRGLAESAGTTQLLLRSVKALGTWLTPISRSRTQPLVLGRRRQMQAELHIAIPHGFHVAQLPPPVEYRDERVHFALSWLQSGQLLHLKQNLTIEASIVSAADLAEWKKMQHIWSTACDAPAILEADPGVRLVGAP